MSLLFISRSDLGWKALVLEFLGAESHFLGLVHFVAQALICRNLLLCTLQFY